MKKWTTYYDVVHSASEFHLLFFCFSCHCLFELQKKRQPYLRIVFLIAWQRPTLTGARAPTTIGAEKLNFRVRYGNGCDLLAIITRLFGLRFHSLKTR